VAYAAGAGVPRAEGVSHGVSHGGSRGGSRCAAKEAKERDRTGEAASTKVSPDTLKRNRLMNRLRQATEHSEG
jgi:hypothetical protein